MLVSEKGLSILEKFNWLRVISIIEGFQQVSHLSALWFILQQDAKKDRKTIQGKFSSTMYFHFLSFSLLSFFF